MRHGGSGRIQPAKAEAGKVWRESHEATDGGGRYGGGGRQRAHHTGVGLERREESWMGVVVGRVQVHVAGGQHGGVEEVGILIGGGWGPRGLAVRV